MVFKEVGFRPLYHFVAAFELNDKLRELIKNCPDATKSSHAVTYGYIDPEKGFMLEILGGGKQAPKYFYFKDPYEGERISIPATEVEDVEFIFFPDLEPRFRKKFQPRIDELKKYNVSEKIEKTRELDFLDGLRSKVFPDEIRVILIKDGLEDETVLVRMSDLGDHVLIGELLEQPKQEFGISKGDTIEFNAKSTDDKKIVCYMDMTEPHELTKEDLADGSVLKESIQHFLVDTSNQNAFGFLLAVLRSSEVMVPCEIHLSDEAAELMNRLEKDGKDVDSLDGDQAQILQDGMQFIPAILESEGHKFVPVFSNEAEMGDKLEDAARVTMPFIHAMDMATDAGSDIEGIVINAYTDNFILNKDLYDTIYKMEPLFIEPEDIGMEGDNEFYTNQEDLHLALVVGKMDVFNLALHQNNIPPIRGIQIFNDTGDTIDGLSIRITSDYEFFKKYESVLPPIPSGKPISLPDPNLRINGKELAGLTESVNASINVELCKSNQIICGVRGKMQVLAYDQWQGGSTYRDLLPAFVLPNHPVIPMLMHDAADWLAKKNKPAQLDGYQSEDPNRVRDLIAAAYAAIQKRNIVYAEPPASFSVPGQRIRTPEIIMEQRLGTCMDMTLLFAALVEAIGLHPILVMMKGHIFAGVWLKERIPEEFKTHDVVIDNIEQLTMRIDNGSDEMTFVECTSMCSGKQVNFAESEDAAKHIGLDPNGFQFAIDVFLSRIYGVTPIASRLKDGGEFKIEIAEKEDDDLTEAPVNLGLTLTEFTKAKPHKIGSKRELWESKLLDLSTHNMLLNLPMNSSIEPIMSSHIDELEDALVDGHEFNLLSVPEWILAIGKVEKDKKGKEKEVQWLPDAIKKYGIFEITNWPIGSDFDFNEKFRQEYRSHRLYTFCNEKQLERELTGIYRAARSSQQENGVSSLYLAVGLLRWFPDAESSEPCYAPLILVPIEIIRKSANTGYALHARDEEPHFNTTLLEMLKQNYNLEIGGLEPLPTDEHGTNIKQVFAAVRSALFTVKNWDVVETCVIGNFSFAQFAMWNDIHTAGEALDNSKIVRSLMKGHVDWEVSALDDLEEEQVYLPITVDATQLKAIKMAAHGTTFVLHGPPGTGKSQTITGMIANLMAQGKTVLFVAEKMAALSVVQKRLASLGIGDFCLELHSDKANKKQVLSQLEKALAVQHPSRKTEYDEWLRKSQKSREKLDGYASHLHKQHICGYSLRELIALYETVRDGEKIVRFDRDSVGDLTKEEIKLHLPLISQLTAAGEAIGGIAGNPLIGVGLTSYSADVRSELKRVVQNYKEHISDARCIGERVAKTLGVDIPKGKNDLVALDRLVSLYQDKKGTEPLFLALLKGNPDEAYKYFEMKEIDTVEEMLMLNVWKPEFLKMDMSDFLARHEAAGKKFFGKANAMAQITAVIQGYANKQITYEQIPNMLRQVIARQDKSKELMLAYTALSESTKALLKQLPNREAYKSAYEAALDCQKQAASFPGGLDAIMGLAGNNANSDLFEELQSCIKDLEDAEKKLNELLVRQSSEKSDDWFSAETKFCDYLIDNPSELKDWGLYNQVRQECIKVGLYPVVEAYEYTIEATDLLQAYKKGLYYALINNIISSDDVLSAFSGATFNEAIEQFKKIDDALLENTKKEIYHRLASMVPTAWDSPEVGMELNLLRKAIGSNARGMSIRNLFDRLPHVLQSLCPCMLMSPNSVAQYLAQDNNLFDVVIFDEASQLPTCKAVGALSRAKDAVIVGDPKQMPPTAFFSGGGPDVDDLALDDLDSILDDALALGIPSQHLQWHYRSTHESLIAFSNSKFYENKMYTFPSANDRERHVTAVHVDGLYSKSTNVKEAEAVVEEVIRRFNTPELKEQSIGIVTFNVKQQALIENLLAKQFQNNPEMDLWANKGEDALFVKNLENVQGDERDVILFSIGYGPDEKGHISNNFGPINKTGGGKRLNVAFSRARVTMTIFSSIYSTDIKISETSPEGLIAFRDFLKFAEGHDIYTESNAEMQKRLARAGIMQNICKAIAAHGYQYETMVGHSDFHVDIAVVDPLEPTKYMMGILLDGDGYRQTKNTRDREVAQIGVLKHLGWTLCRVWTIDWWDNREKELNKLLTKLEQLKFETEQKIEKQKAAEEARREEEAAREAELMRVKEELQVQAAEVVAEDEEAEKSQRGTSISRETSEVEKFDDESVEEEMHNHEVVFSEGDKSDSASETSEQEKNELNAMSTSDKAEGKVSDSPLSVLVNKLKEANAKIVDKRQNGGALWIIGGKELQPIMNEFKMQGIVFAFKVGGGKATGGKDGWWAKTEIELPAPEKVETSVPCVPVPTENQKKQDTPIAEEDVSTNVNDSAEVVETVSDVQTSSDEQKQEAEVSANVIVDYKVAHLEEAFVSPTEFVAAYNKSDLVGKILTVVEVEGPIQKDVLMRKVFAAYGVSKSGATVEAFEKALKVAKVKNTKQKGVVFCWNEGQDPKTYSEIRVTNERSGDEICQQEISNAICHILKEKGSMDKDELIKETSILFGYKRLGKNLEASLLVGLQYARTSGFVVPAGGNHFELAK